MPDEKLRAELEKAYDDGRVAELLNRWSAEELVGLRLELRKKALVNDILIYTPDTIGEALDRMGVLQDFIDDLGEAEEDG